MRVLVLRAPLLRSVGRVTVVNRRSIGLEFNEQQLGVVDRTKEPSEIVGQQFTCPEAFDLIRVDDQPGGSSHEDQSIRPLRPMQSDILAVSQIAGLLRARIRCSPQTFIAKPDSDPGDMRTSIRLHSRHERAVAQFVARSYELVPTQDLTNLSGSSSLAASVRTRRPSGPPNSGFVRTQRCAMTPNDGFRWCGSRRGLRLRYCSLSSCGGSPCVPGCRRRRRCRGSHRRRRQYPGSLPGTQHWWLGRHRPGSRVTRHPQPW